MWIGGMNFAHAVGIVGARAKRLFHVGLVVDRGTSARGFTFVLPGGDPATTRRQRVGAQYSIRAVRRLVGLNSLLGLATVVLAAAGTYFC